MKYNFRTDLKYVEYFLKMEKYHDAGDSLKNVKNSWDSMEDTWAIFIHHDDIEKVEVGMSEIASYIESEEKEEAIAKIKAGEEWTVRAGNGVSRFREALWRPRTGEDHLLPAQRQPGRHPAFPDL